MKATRVIRTAAVAVVALALSAGPAATAWAPDGQKPARPARPEATEVASDSVTISWADPGDASITGYRILRRDRNADARGVWHIIADDVTGTSYTDDTVEAPGSYAYRIRARNAFGMSPRSRSARAEVLETAPQQQQLELSVTGSTAITVDENTLLSHQIEATLTGAEGDVTYEYEAVNCCDDSDAGYDWDWEDLNLSSSGLLTSYAWLDYEELVPALSFAVDVRITATAGTDEVSIVETFTVSIADQPESSVQNLTVTGQTSTTISLDWDPPAGLDSWFVVWVYESATGGDPARYVTKYWLVYDSLTVDRLEPETSHDLYVMPEECASRGYCRVHDAVSVTHSTGAVPEVNTAPRFTSDAALEFAENRAFSHQVSAYDDDPDDRAGLYSNTGITGYEITGGTDQSAFAINGDWLTLTAGEPLDFESQSAYEVEVTATSGSGARELSTGQTITVTVTDVDEKPSAPQLSIDSSTSTSVTLTWDEPANTGPAISDYDVRYRARNATGWTAWAHDGTARTATITGLAEDSDNDFQVRAYNDESHSDWSPAAMNYGAVSVAGSTSIRIEQDTLLSHQIEVQRNAAHAGSSLTFEAVGCCDSTAEDYDSDWDHLQLSSSGLLSSPSQLTLGGSSTSRSFAVDARITSTAGTDEASIVETFTVTVVPELFPPVENLTATGQTPTTISLDWDAPTGSEPTYYIVYVYESGSADLQDREVDTIFTVYDSDTVDRLDPETGYEFKVVAVTCRGGCNNHDPAWVTHSTDPPGLAPSTDS